ncbi:MAG: tetratricopeptide repeat protein [Pirellulales bacterium]|nr:tetratricopeptide repeat protein [Pirellulales bacterium]
MDTRSVALTILLGATTSVVGDEALESASQYVGRGMQRFRDNQVAESIRDFQQAAKLDPHRAPRLWQLGISHYYAGKFDEGRQQFELHQTVNPHDVENAAWHFLCVARLEGIEAARKSLIRIDTTRDRRIPMSEIYDFYAGRGPEITVIRAAERAGTKAARMYAHLYLGLYYEVANKAEPARAHIRKAAAANLMQHTMHDVAKIHLLQRKWKP